MKKEQLLAIGGAAVIGCVAYYIWRKKHPKREIGSVGTQYDTAYSYEEAVKKAREKINAGLKDDRVRLVPTLEKPNLKVQAVKQEDMKNYNALASEYDSIFDNADLTVVDDSDSEPGITVEPTWDTEWWMHDLDNDEDAQPKYNEPVVDLPPEESHEEAIKAESTWIPMRDDDIGAYFRISEDKYKHENLDFGKEQGVFNAENKALMLANQGILGPETELFRRVATLVFEDEEDFADALYFQNVSKKVDVKITVQM